MRQSWLRGATQLHWTRAHLDWPSAQQHGFPWRAWAGNQRADELVWLGATAHAPSSSDASKVLKSRCDAAPIDEWLLPFRWLPTMDLLSIRTHAETGSSDVALAGQQREVGYVHHLATILMCRMTATAGSALLAIA